MDEPDPLRIYHFGPFRLDVEDKALRRSGELVSIPPKTFDVLCFLVLRAGSLVTREEIQRAVRPDVVIDDNNLPVHISSLRRILGDNTANPVFIATVARRGYRFVATVHDAGSQPVSVQPPDPPMETPARPARSPGIRRRFFWAMSAIAASIAVVLAFQFRRPEVSWNPVPVTFAPGLETSPAISPDGTRVLYTALTRDSRGLWVQRIGDPAPTRLSDGYDYNPAWSPDGKEIAFLHVADRVELRIRSSFGGPDRVLRQMEFDGPPPGPFLEYSPNGEWILTSDGSGMPAGLAPRRLIAISTKTGESRDLLTPVAGTAGDSAPALSPSGDRIAFCRCIAANSCDLYLAPARDLRLTGPPERLTDSPSPEFRVQFLRDGSILVPLGPPFARTMRRIRFDPLGRAHSLSLSPPGEDVFQPSVSIRPDGPPRAVYVQRTADINIWGLDLDRPGGPAATSSPLFASTRSEETPAYSPDGKRVAFASTRSGHWEIWTCRSDGEECRQVTRLGPAFSHTPTWSPNGEWIVFESRPTSAAHLYAVPAVGGTPRRITSGADSYVEPVWTADGRWLYYSSNRSGQFEIYRSPAPSEAAPLSRFEQMTTAGGTIPSVSPDGKTLLFLGKDGFTYYRTDSDQSVRKLPSQGPVTIPLLARDGLAYAYVAENRTGYLARFRWNSTDVELLHKVDLSRTAGLALSPDGRRLLFVKNDRMESDLYYADLADF